MQEFFKMDLFFFITSAVIIVLGLLAGVFLFYVIRIAKTVDHILFRIRSETDIITDEIGELRRNIRKEGVKLKHLSRFVKNISK